MANAQNTHGVYQNIEVNRLRFAAAFFAIFALCYTFLFSVGATPDATNTTGSDTAMASTTSVPASTASAPAQGELPTRITIPAANLDVTVSDPESTDTDVLDNALLKGAVRYPTSALLGEQGTMLLFGHSSYLPIVHNQAYKTFDGIQNLKPGDLISVYSPAREYRFSVTGVKTANANQDSVELANDGQHLTLVTCDSFATKSDRFIVTADLVGTYSLAN